MTDKEFTARLRLLEKKHAFLTMLRRYRRLQHEIDAARPALLRRQAG